MIPAETPEEARRIRISTESKELRLEFDQKYNDKLVKSLGEENKVFILKIKDLFERYKNIKEAISEAFKDIEGSNKTQSEIDELVIYVEGTEEKKDEKGKNNSGIQNPYYPIIQRLKSIDGIKIPDNLFDENDPVKLKKEIIRIINSIKDENLKKAILDLINPDGENEAKKITREDFEQSDFFKDFSGNNEAKPSKDDDFDILIANNYIRYPNISDAEKSNYNKERNLITALDITKNKIIEGEDNDFRKRNGTLIKEIENTNELGEKYLLVKKLFKESLKDNGMKSALNVQTRIDGKKPDENNSFFEKLRKLIQEHSKKLNDKIDNGYDLSKFISELSGFSEQVNDFLDENPNNPQGLEIKETIEQLTKNPKNINRLSIENLKEEIIKLI